VKSREKFLVLEIAPEGTQGWFLSVDDDRNIIFEKTVKDIDLKKFFKFTRAPMRSLTQKSWEGEQMFKSRRRVIAAADPRLATTIPIPLDLPRDEGLRRSKITSTEAENMIAQALQKIFNGCRTEAASRLKIHELDAVLVGAKAARFKVDGKAVASPAGYPGKEISLFLELTFTTRDIFDDLQQFFNSPDEFFFVEAPQAHLVALSRIRKLPLNLIVAKEHGAALYVFQHAKGEHPVLYRETIEWAFDAVFKAIREAFSVSDDTARELYKMYRRGGTSADVARAFKKMLEPALAAFFKEIERAKVNGAVYIDTVHDLPFDVPYKHAGASFEAHPIGDVLGKFGFSADLAKRSNADVRAAIYFLEAYFDKSNSLINEKLRRRVHWLKV